MRLVGCSYCCVVLVSLLCWWNSHVVIVDANYVNHPPSPSRVNVFKKSFGTTLDKRKIVGGSNESEEEGTATIPNEIFNLVKSIVGAGVLSLPAGK